MKTFTLNTALYTRLSNLYGEGFKCQLCGLPFKVGDTVVSHTIYRKTTPSSTFLKHKECFERRLIDV